MTISVIELFMYRCEVCGVVVLSNEDHGIIWYNDCCGICKTWTYYERVIISSGRFFRGVEEEKYG